MYGIPSIPTDNLYKTMAISGIWMVLGFLAALTWIFSTEIKTTNQLADITQYYKSKNTANQIKTRIDEITKGTDKHKLPWTPPNATSDEEKYFLEQALKNHQETMEKTINPTNIEAMDEFSIIKKYELIFLIALIFYVFFMLYLTYFGFTRWHKNIQKPDIEIKNLTIEKLKLENEKLRKEIA